MWIALFMCKFLITPTQGTDTGSENGIQPPASFHRQHTVTATFWDYIQPLPQTSHQIDPLPSFYPFCSTKEAYFFSPGCQLLRGVPPKGSNCPNHKGEGCCNRRTPWLTSKRSPSWDWISLHPLLLSPAVIPSERLSRSHILITAMC